MANGTTDADRQLRAMGRVVFEQGLLPQVASSVVWALLDVEQDLGQRITGKAMLSQVLRWLRDLAIRIPDESLRTNIRNWAKRAEKLAEERNATIHAVWILTEDPSEVMRFSGKGDAPERVDPDYLDSLADRLRAQTRELVGLIDELGKVLPRTRAVLTGEDFDERGLQ